MMLTKETQWPSVINNDKKFIVGKHRLYIDELELNKESLAYLMSEHLRLGGLFWAAGSLDVMGLYPFTPSDGLISKEMKRESSSIKDSTNDSSSIKDSTNDSSSIKDGEIHTKDSRKEMIELISKCYDPVHGGYGSSIGHDSHLTSTLYALLTLSLFDALHEVKVESVVNWIRSLQNIDGSFSADRFGEVDGRFSLCAVTILTILNRLDAIDIKSAINWILQCQNPDGGFGNIPGAESHAAYVFCCVSALWQLGGLPSIDKDELGFWLAARQIPGCGGFNGRPEKAPDVCYSWWILASLKIIGRDHWIDSHSLSNFILSCQDQDDGGIADRSEDMPDIFHTFFGIMALSLLRVIKELKSVDPVYSLSVDVVKKNKFSVPFDHDL